LNGVILNAVLQILERKMDNITVYTKDGCRYCTLTKNLLEQKNLNYTEMKIGADLTREDFINLFPTVKTVPYIIIDGENYDYARLVRYAN